MPQEDKFKKQVDQLARALAKALNDLVGAKTPAALQEALQQADQTISENKNPNDPEQVALMADLLYEMAEKGHSGKTELYQKARQLYIHLNSTGNTWSMERQLRIGSINHILAQ